MRTIKQASELRSKIIQNPDFQYHIWIDSPKKNQIFKDLHSEYMNQSKEPYTTNRSQWATKKALLKMLENNQI